MDIIHWKVTDMMERGVRHKGEQQRRKGDRWAQKVYDKKERRKWERE